VTPADGLRRAEAGSTILEIADLRISDPAGRPLLSGVDLQLVAGRIQGLAGESGSGKTLTSLAALGLLPATLRAAGSIRLGGEELLGLPARRWNQVRGRRIAMVFQDPSTSLHPMLSVGAQLTDHARLHLRLGRAEARERAAGMLARVRVPDPEGALRRFPHQFSGGQRQRIAIAGALMCEPEVLIADEPTTALDVTVQAGVLRLLRGLADELGLAVLLVTHDLGVMSAIADDVAVMRAGRVVESGERHQVFTAPRSEYTRALLAALPGSAEGVQTLDDVRALVAQEQGKLP
jgi:peptide/nickel transport system ATP-binding protein